MTGSDADASVEEPEVLDVTPQMLFPSMSDMVEKRPKGISRNVWFQNRCASMTPRHDMATVKRDRKFRCCSLLQQVVDRWLEYRDSVDTEILNQLESERISHNGINTFDNLINGVVFTDTDGSYTDPVIPIYSLDPYTNLSGVVNMSNPNGADGADTQRYVCSLPHHAHMIDSSVDRSEMLLSELAPACDNRLDLHAACSVRDVQEADEVLGVQGRGDTLCRDEYVCPDSCMHIFSQQCPDDVACDADACCHPDPHPDWYRADTQLAHLYCSSQPNIDLDSLHTLDGRHEVEAAAAEQLSMARKLSDWRESFTLTQAKQACRKVTNAYSCSVLCSGGCLDTLAAIRSGFVPIWGTEIDPVMKTMWSDLTGTKCLGDTFAVDYSQQRRPSCLFSGQPCPDFSLSGGKKGVCGNTGWQYVAQCDVILKLQPHSFVLEMVANVMDIDNGSAV